MSVTPDFVGQRYKDTNTGNIWIANSTTPGDWTLEVQNMQAKWLPHNLKLGEIIGFTSSLGPLTGITQLALLGSLNNESITINSAPDLVTITMDNMQYVIDVQIASNPLLKTISASSLTNIYSTFSISINNTLTSVVFDSLVDFAVGSDFNINQNPALTLISMPVFVPQDGLTMNFTNNALTAACVNSILARCVANPAYASGYIHLQGGTSSAPTGQGIIDKATLNARLAGLAVTN